MIRNLEELSLNAWPSLQTMVYDGWILRFSNGYTKRANSVNPLYSSSIDINKKIQLCEDVYQKQDLPTVFKITSAVFPGGLDERLHAKGYRIDSPTSVQMIDLSAVNLQDLVMPELEVDLSDTWLASFCSMSAVSRMHIKTLQKILMNIVPDHCFVAIKSNERIVACGLGVVQSGYVGLFDIITDNEFRNRGYGEQIVKSILEWGRQNKAQMGYLQVMLNNRPALNLYAKIGFVERYQYWYRLKL